MKHNKNIWIFHANCLRWRVFKTGYWLITLYRSSSFVLLLSVLVRYDNSTTLGFESWNQRITLDLILWHRILFPLSSRNKAHGYVNAMTHELRWRSCVVDATSLVEILYHMLGNRLGLSQLHFTWAQMQTFCLWMNIEHTQTWT